MHCSKSKSETPKCQTTNEMSIDIWKMAPFSHLYSFIMCWLKLTQNKGYIIVWKTSMSTQCTDYNKIICPEAVLLAP